MDGPAPAVLNALARALGAEPERVPCRPEYLMLLADPAVADARG
jgi:hypothetical protein